MLERDIYCPFCDKDFTGEAWESGQCPYCGVGYWWYEECSEDYSECWDMIDWDRSTGNNQNQNK